MESITAWINMKMKIICIAFFVQILLSESSPLNKETRTENSACAEGWIHYQRFCVIVAKGGTETAVALYCDGFGGIGIKGYCITKAHVINEDSIGHSGDRSASLREALLRAAENRAPGDDNVGGMVNVPQDADQGLGSSSQYEPDVEEIVCQKGWKHYGKICVYQPLSVKEECHLLNAVEFSGLCLKHADLAAVERRGMKYGSSEREKRVCCCAHISAKSNAFGCY